MQRALRSLSGPWAVPSASKLSSQPIPARSPLCTAPSDLCMGGDRLPWPSGLQLSFLCRGGKHGFRRSDLLSTASCLCVGWRGSTFLPLTYTLHTPLLSARNGCIQNYNPCAGGWASPRDCWEEAQPRSYLGDWGLFPVWSYLAHMPPSTLPSSSLHPHVDLTSGLGLQPGPPAHSGSQSYTEGLQRN